MNPKESKSAEETPAQESAKNVAPYLKKLGEIKLKCSEKYYNEIHRQLVMLYKYLALRQQRERNYGFKDVILTDEQRFALDGKIKITIYGKKIADIASYLNFLPVDVLKKLFTPLTLTPEQLLDNLKNYNFLENRANVKWEQKQQAKASWLLRCRTKIKTTAQFIYQHSLIGPGAILLQKLGLWLLPNRVNKSSVIQNLLTGVGAGLGLSLSYSLGIYAMARSLVLSILVKKVNEIKIDDNNATVSLPRYSAATTMQLFNLAITTLEAMYSRDYLYFLYNIGSMAGAFGLSMGAKRYWPSQSKGAYSELQLVELFIFTIRLGIYITSACSNTWSTISTKLQARSLMTEQMRHLETQSIPSRIPSFF